MAAQCALADLPLAHFCEEQVVPYETDEVTRLIVDTHDAEAFAPVRSLTVGELRDWLLSDEATPERIAALAPGADAGDGRGRKQADAGAGPDCGGREDARGDALSHHGGAAGAAERAAAAEPSRRTIRAGHCRRRFWMGCCWARATR